MSNNNTWESPFTTAKELGIDEKDLTNLREYGLFKPGLHWKSSPCKQNKPWNPEVIYNIKGCKKIIRTSTYFEILNQYAA